MGSPARLRRLAAAALVASSAVPLAAADRHVATTGVDVPGCLDPLDPCRTIQHAVSEAVDGDVVQVAAGLYAERVAVAAKSLTLAGGPGVVVSGSGLDRVLAVTAGASVRLLGFVLEDGVAAMPSIRGGAVLVEAAELAVVDSTIRSSIGVYGGGLYNDRGTVRLLRCTVTGNRGLITAGIESFEGTLQIVNSTISQNVGGEAGGLVVFGGAALIASTTIAFNSATEHWATGGGFGGGGGGAAVAVRNTIIAGNSAGHGSTDGADCAGTLRSEGYNLIGNPRGCTLLGDPTGNQFDVDAGLDPLADNAGATWTMALRPSSPALDAGDPAGCRDGVGAPLFTDQRGRPRPNACGGGWRCDIGAFEMQCATDFRRLYESPAASAVITPANDRGLLFSSPHDHRPPTAAAILYYQADDGAGSPARIDLVRSDDGIRVFF